MGNSAKSLPPVGETDEAEFRLNAFHVMGEVLDHTLDLHVLLDSVLDMFLELTRADAGFIMLVDEKADALVFGAAKGLKKGVVKKIKVSIEKDIAREITRKKLPILLARVKEPRLGSFFRELLEPLREVEITRCYPLVSSRKLVGLVNTTESSSGTVFKKTDPRLLFGTICNRVAAAIVNSLLHQHLVERFKELREQSRALRESEQRIHAVVENAGEGIITIDERSVIESFNRAAERIFGYAAKEVIGEKVTVLMNPDDRERHNSCMQGYLRTGCRTILGAGPREFSARRKDGTSFPMELACSEMILGDKRLFIGIMLDITERKESQAQLIQSSKLATLGEMATAMAHELNQPLNVIRMAADNVLERIEDGKADAKYLQGKLERISAQTERAAAIIDHMRIFGRKSDAKPEPFDPRKVVKDALGLVGQQLRVRNIEVETALSGHYRSVLGHASQLEQVVLNLVTNARHAIEANRTSPGDQGKISLIVEDVGSENTVRLIVEDSGGGIPEDVIQRIFEPFYTTKKKGEGTGLGLSVSYGIIKDMGGTIEAANAGEGAQFTVTLPIAEDDKKSSMKSKGSSKGSSRAAG